MIVVLPYQEKIKLPLSKDSNFQGDVGDGFLYPGNLKRLALESFKLEFDTLTHAEADALLEDIYSGLSSGNRLRVWDKFYIASGDFLEEVRDFDFVKISLTLREVL